jgi:hypothetical protein
MILRSIWPRILTDRQFQPDLFQLISLNILLVKALSNLERGTGKKQAIILAENLFVFTSDEPEILIQLFPLLAGHSSEFSGSEDSPRSDICTQGGKYAMKNGHGSGPIW